MRIVRMIAACMILAGAVAHAQDARSSDRGFLELEHVGANGSYILGLNEKSEVSNVKGFGGGAEARFALDEMFFVEIGGSYGKVTLDEKDPITKWNWEYWKRLYRNYIVLWLGSDSAYFGGRLITLRNISNEQLTAGRYTGKDSLYSVELHPRQYLNVYPFSISVGARYEVIDAVTVEGIVTGTVMPFERNLYLDESWSKRRRVDVGPDSGNYYYFNYGFRNYANPRRGTAFGLGGTVVATADVSDMFTLYASAHYTQFTAALRKDSYDILPMESILLLNAGIRIRY